MKIEDVIVVVIVLAIAVGIILYLRKSKKKGGKCAGCPYCNQCSSKTKSSCNDNSNKK